MKYLELFKNGFDSTIDEKIKPENWPYVEYSPSEGLRFSMAKTEDGYTLITLKKVDISNISYEEVDLGYGLPIWANKNIGAASKEDYGTYFSWGNTDGYTAITKFLTVEETCSMFSSMFGEEITTKEQLEAIFAAEGVPLESVSMSEEYSFDEDSYSTTTGKSLTSDITSENDAATANMGEAWRLPTIAEYQALIKAVKANENEDGLTCKYIYLDKEGKRQELQVYNEKNSGDCFYASGLIDENGNYLFSKILGIEFSNDSTNASLYFPASGVVDGPVLSAIKIHCYYWSSSIINDSGAHTFYVNQFDIGADYYCYRRCGLCVRAVK